MDGILQTFLRFFFPTMYNQNNSFRNHPHSTVAVKIKISDWTPEMTVFSHFFMFFRELKNLFSKFFSRQTLKKPGVTRFVKNYAPKSEKYFLQNQGWNWKFYFGNIYFVATFASQSLQQLRHVWFLGTCPPAALRALCIRRPRGSAGRARG